MPSDRDSSRVKRDGKGRLMIEPRAAGDGTMRLYGVGPRCPGCGGPTHCVGSGGERPWWCQHCNVRLDADGDYGSSASYPAGANPDE